MNSCTSQPRRVVSLEAFIIDTVIHDDKAHTQDDQIGGSGTYAMIGARMFLPPLRLGMVINYFPLTLPGWMKNRLDSFGSSMWYFKKRQDGLGTTRSVQNYVGGVRSEVLHDPLLCNPVDLLDTPFGSAMPSTIHITSLLDRTKIILEQVDQISRSTQVGWQPTVVWEPYYADAIPVNLGVIRRYIPQVDVISPNHVEALSLCSIPSSSLPHKAIEEACTTLATMTPKKAVVIRSGALGACYALSSEPHIVHWIPAYWTEGDTAKVVDVTGAGNSFLGGLCAGLDEGLDVRTAVIWGTVAASFIVEQVGLPIMTTGDDEIEMWNGCEVARRVESLKVSVDNS